MSSPVSPPSASPVGVCIASRYRLVRRVGQGGMAEVWVADDLELNRTVAIKWLKPVLAADPIIAERFRREAVAVARVRHPNIVPIYDVVAHEGRQVVVMELIDGKSLRQVLDGQKRLSPELTVHVGAQIASALDAAHRAGLVHRDVKPGNIMMHTNGKALLTDFGIAKELRGSGLGEDLTSDNIMMGTAKYLSPELVRGRRLDGRADLYSLGLVLYECLAGRVPFLGESDADTALARLQRDPTDLGQLRPTLPVGLINLIHTTLNRNPDHRPQTGAELADALDAVDLERPVIDKTPTQPRPRNGAKVASGPIPGEPHITAQTPEITRDTGPRGGKASQATDKMTGKLAGMITGRHPVQSAVPDATPEVTAGGFAAANGSFAPPSADQLRDNTPPAPRLHGRPARHNEHRNGPALILVGGLLAVAALLVIVLVVIARDPARTTPTGTSTPAATEAATGPVATVDPAVTPAAGPAAGSAPAQAGTSPTLSAAPSSDTGIASVSAWDPFGTNGTENNELATAALADDNPATVWMTECYSNRFMSGKEGVGLIIDLGETTPGILRFNVGTAPYQVQTYAFVGDSPPADFNAWTPVGNIHFDEKPTDVRENFRKDTRFILIWFKEVGVGPGCSADNPNRGVLGELSFDHGTVD